MLLEFMNSTSQEDAALAVDVALVSGVKLGVGGNSPLLLQGLRNKFSVNSSERIVRATTTRYESVCLARY